MNKMLDTAEAVAKLWHSAPNTREGIEQAKQQVRCLLEDQRVSPQALAEFITKQATAQGRRVNVRWLRYLTLCPDSAVGMHRYVDGLDGVVYCNLCYKEKR